MTAPTTLAGLKSQNAADEAEKLAAVRAEQRTALLRDLLSLQTNVTDELQAVKDRKTTLKTVRDAIAAIEDNEDATNEDLAQVIISSQISLGLVDPFAEIFKALSGPGFHRGGFVNFAGIRPVGRSIRENACGEIVLPR